MEGGISFEELSSFYENSDETQYCDECDWSYTQIQVHKALAHRGKEQKICNICGLQFSKNKQLVNHLTEHRRDRIKCHFCKRKDFNGLNDFLKHLEEHESLHVFLCSFCSKTFTVRQHFHKHIKKKHHVSVLSQANNETLLTHNSVEIDGRERSPNQLDKNELNDKFLCSFCHKFLPDKQRFDRHMKKKHDSRSINQSNYGTLPRQKSSDDVNELEQFAKHSQENESSLALSKHRKRKYSASILDQNVKKELRSPVEIDKNPTEIGGKEKYFEEEQTNSPVHKASLNESKDKVKLVTDKPKSQKSNVKIRREFIDKSDPVELENRGSRKSLWDGSNDFSDGESVDDDGHSSDDDGHSSDDDGHSSDDDIVDSTCFKCKLVVDGRSSYATSRHFVAEHNRGSMECKSCGKTVKSTRHLYFHALRHAGAEPWKCDICSIKFVSKYVYKRHLTKVHQKEKCYSCDVCGEKFTYLLSYQAHLLEHHDELQFSCEFCGQKFKYKYVLCVHQEKVSCPQCDLTFGCKASFDNHMTDFHSLDVCFACPHCDRSFDKRNKLNLHLTLKHVDKLKRNFIYCKFCDYSTHITYNLTRHVKARHSLS